eukprot:scaffold263713_cov22-Prasinocladus_malaysianus.AAC.1
MASLREVIFVAKFSTSVGPTLPARLLCLDMPSYQNKRGGRTLPPMLFCSSFWWEIHAQILPANYFHSHAAWFHCPLTSLLSVSEPADLDKNTSNGPV